MTLRLWVGLLLVLAVVPAIATQKTATTKTIWDAVFSEQQATRGRQIYKQSCANCHKEDLLGETPAPALVGQDFLIRFNGSTVDDLVQAVRASMPQEAPNSLTPAAYVDLIGYLLKENGSPAGTEELPADREKLRQIIVTMRPP